jgi:hypothetical protein
MDDHNLVVWDRKDQSDFFIPGERYQVTSVQLKTNDEGFNEYHTGKFSNFIHLDTEQEKSPRTASEVALAKSVTKKPPPRIAGMNGIQYVYSPFEKELLKKLDQIIEMI